MLDLKAQHSAIRNDIHDAVERVLTSQHFILGPEVEALEHEIAGVCGARFAVGVSSGTDALLASLMAIQVGPGDEVITTPFSFFATAGVIARLGARPVFVDIDPATFNIDASRLESAVTPRTRAILPVHLFGRCADMEAITAVAERHGLDVIEDAAQAIGSTDDRGRRAGTMGRAGCFSFFPSKNLGGAGDGGMVVTDDADLADRLRLLRVHGARPKYHHRILGGNFRLDALQAAILRVKLKHLPAWNEARRRNAAQYRVLFDSRGLPGRASLPSDVPGHIYNQFVVRFRDRDRLQAVMQERGIQTEVYYPVPLHFQECFRDYGYRRGAFPEAESAAGEALALPVYPELTGARQAYVVDTITDFYLRSAA